MYIQPFLGPPDLSTAIRGKSLTLTPQPLKFELLRIPPLEKADSVNRPVVPPLVDFANPQPSDTLNCLDHVT